MGLSMPGRMNHLLYDALAGYVTVPGSVHLPANKRQVCCQLYKLYIGVNIREVNSYNSSIKFGYANNTLDHSLT